MKKSNEKYTILYARLSQEDGNDGISNSIENQRFILEKYASDNGFENTKFMFDDGYSGTTMKRPAWIEVNDLIINKKVENLIVKDISRVARDARKLSELIEDTFPDNDVRFISIGDNVDSLYGIDDFLPFRGLFHEYYAKDCSRKQRQVKKAKAERGERVATRPPYGYKNKVDNPKEIEIDTEVEYVIKEIFTLCANGRGPTQIARELKERKYLTPSNYYFSKTGKSLFGTDSQDLYKWSGDSVKFILANETYLGHTVNLKTTSKSFKDKRTIKRAKEDWLVFENTHQAIIDKDLWELAHKTRANKIRPRINFAEPSMYAGLMFCADCGEKLILHRRHSESKAASFSCSTYKKKGKEVCSIHTIREDNISAVILDDIKRVTHFARQQKDVFIEFISRKSTVETRKQINKLDKEIETIKKRDREIDSLFKKLFESHVIGQLPAEMYRKLSDQYLVEQSEIKKLIPQWETALEKLKNSIANTDKFIERAEKYTELSTLTPEILRHFIDKIVVHEKKSKNSAQKVEIHYRDIGYLEDYTKETDIDAPIFYWIEDENGTWKDIIVDEKTA